MVATSVLLFHMQAAVSAWYQLLGLVYGDASGHPMEPSAAKCPLLLVLIRPVLQSLLANVVVSVDGQEADHAASTTFTQVSWQCNDSIHHISTVGFQRCQV